MADDSRSERTNVDPYRKFAGLLLSDYCDDWGSDIDGAHFQACLVESGLAEELRVTEPCSDGDHARCACAEVGEFPQTCYRLIPDANRAKSDLPPIQARGDKAQALKSVDDRGACPCGQVPEDMCDDGESRWDKCPRIPSRATNTRNGEPVAWRWRVMSDGQKEWDGWCYGPNMPANLSANIAWEWQPLFTVPVDSRSSTSQPSALADKLEKLAFHATAAPWHYTKPKNPANGIGTLYGPDCLIYTSPVDIETQQFTRDRQAADGALMAALRNALPEILERLRSATAQRPRTCSCGAQAGQYHAVGCGYEGVFNG